jgi:hypothetical protein
MPTESPILALDTSSINKLTADPEFTVLVAGLKTGYHIRLNGSNIAEIAATQNAEKRERLLDTCQRLLIQGDCIDPFNWIVEKHTKRFDANPTDYDWKRVNVTNRVFEKEVTDRGSLNDEMARQEKTSAEESKKQFEELFCSMRPGFDKIFAKGTKRPAKARRRVLDRVWPKVLCAQRWGQARRSEDPGFRGPLSSIPHDDSRRRDGAV